VAPTESSSVERLTYGIDTTASALLIEARSTVGPIELATTALTGCAVVTLNEAGSLDDSADPSAVIELAVASLTSGNALYDAEVQRRLDARRYPHIRAELHSARALDAARWALEGGLTIHGTTRSMTGSADVRLVTRDHMRIVGEQLIDIRDFAISLPSTLMLRIYPDVMVRFRIEARRED
jgi:polyisoprenoid-binding protein YceI